MKIKRNISLSILAGMLGICTAFAQLPAQGILTYQVDTVRRLDQYAGTMRLTGLSIIYKEGGKSTRIYAGYPESFGAPADQVVLFRNEAAFMVFRMPNDSLIVLQLPNSTPLNPNFESVRTEETKYIETLKCQKWVIKDKRRGWTFDAWILEQEDIQIPLKRYFTQFGSIGGLPVEFDMEMSEWLLHVKLRKFDASPLDSKAFEIPSGKTTTFDDFMREIKNFN